MDWFTLALALGSAAMITAAAVFIFLFASEFFMQQPYYEWAVIATGLIVLAVSVAATPLVSGGLSDVIATGMLLGATGTAAGFGQAYRRSAGGI
jgi:hypothetical protein